mmetsp:Transcript_17830/g.32901  ORF Transcript_17830/g.32901 Transcript_17830/m.32901 type:complete len:236 (-) Transcript_17830:525-1232(-)
MTLLSAPAVIREYSGPWTISFTAPPGWRIAPCGVASALLRGSQSRTWPAWSPERNSVDPNRDIRAVTWPFTFAPGSFTAAPVEMSQASRTPSRAPDNSTPSHIAISRTGALCPERQATCLFWLRSQILAVLSYEQLNPCRPELVTKTLEIEPRWPSRSLHWVPLQWHSFESIPALRIDPSGQKVQLVTHSWCPAVLENNCRFSCPVTVLMTLRPWSAPPTTHSDPSAFVAAQKIG